MSARYRGFTIVELIMVILVVAIIAIAAIPRMVNTQTFAARGFYDGTLGIVRYAQKLAIAQRRIVYVNVIAATNTICLSYDAADASCSNASTLVSDPQKASIRFQKVAPGGVTFSASTAFGFSGLGKPTPDSQYSISVVGDSMTRTMTIERETGYVH